MRNWKGNATGFSAETVAPPFGLVMFVVCDILKVTVTEFTREVWPFLLALVAILLTITYVPELVLLLPKLAMR